MCYQYCMSKDIADRAYTTRIDCEQRTWAMARAYKWKYSECDKRTFWTKMRAYTNWHIQYIHTNIHIHILMCCHAWDLIPSLVFYLSFLCSSISLPRSLSLALTLYFSLCILLCVCHFFLLCMHVCVSVYAVTCDRYYLIIPIGPACEGKKIHIEFSSSCLYVFAAYSLFHITCMCVCASSYLQFFSLPVYMKGVRLFVYVCEWGLIVNITHSGLWYSFVTAFIEILNKSKRESEREKNVNSFYFYYYIDFLSYRWWCWKFWYKKKKKKRNCCVFLLVCSLFKRKSIFPSRYHCVQLCVCAKKIVSKRAKNKKSVEFSSFVSKD